MVSVDRLQGLSGDLAIKAPVRVATTAAITLSGLQTIDGVLLVADDRVLVKDQADAADNGIWVATTSSWSRALDCNGDNDLVNGTFITVNSGTTNAGVMFKCSGTDPITVGTDAITFTAQFSQAAASASEVAAAASAVAAAASAADAAAVTAGFGTASTKNTGTAPGTVPLVGTASATTSVAGLVTKSTTVENAAGTGTGVVAAADLPAAVAALAPTSAAPAILQVVSTTIAVATGNTTIPDDATVPVSTEGTQIASLSITPASVSNTVRIVGGFSVVLDAAEAFIVSVFRGSTCIGATRLPAATGNAYGSISIHLVDSPNTTSVATYSVRVGSSTSAGWYVNRSVTSATALGSSMANSRFIAEELSA